MVSPSLVVLAFAAPALAAERVSCPISADTYVYATPWSSERPDDSEAFDNHGGEAQVVIKGREYFTLLQFDLTAARGMTVSKATLRMYLNPNQWPLSQVGVSTISGNGVWGEGTQRGARAAPGAANYFWARTGEQAWAFPGSDLSDVIFGLAGSLYAYPRARDTGGSWWEIDIPPALIHALLSGDQYGLVLSDEKGQVAGRYSLAGREQSQRQPSLILEGDRIDTTPPGPVRPIKTVEESTLEEARGLGRTTLRPGAVILRFGGAGDDAGDGIAAHYELRYAKEPVDAKTWDAAAAAPRWMLDPLAPKPNPLAVANALRDEVVAVVEDLTPGETYYFAARAMDEAGNQGPVSPLGRFRAFTRDWPELPADLPSLDSPSGLPGLRISSDSRPFRTSRRAEARRQAEGLPHTADDGSLRVWAFPELSKINPRTGALLEASDFPDPRARNTVWDAETSTITVRGAGNEFVAFQLAIEAAQPAAGIEVRLGSRLFDGFTIPPVMAPAGAVQFYREWFVRDDQQTGDDAPYYPDPLVPLSGPLSIPSQDNPVSGQTAQPVFVDIYIPRDAAPGTYETTLIVSANGGFRREMLLRVEVLPFVLPDELSFVVDLNGYGGVPSNNRRGTPDYRADVRAWHRIAHLHRANLDILGYSHSGSVEPDYSPPLMGQGADTKIADWTAWDAQFGPLVSGSAFSDLPRAGVPIAALYLNFFENWPGDLHASYKWDNYPRPATTDDYKKLIAQHGLEAGPIEEGFPQDYQERFSAVARQFAEHFRDRGWTSTKYLVYFNDKYFYKDPAQGGRGVSWWLFDEPNYRDDYRASSFLGWLAKQQLADYPDVPITFRTDISYIDFMRDLLSNQVDLNTTSKRFFTRNRFLQDHRDRFGRSFWNYSTTNHPRDTNVAMRSWAWSVWTAGGDGIVPWSTLQADQAWSRAEQLTVFYLGSKFGKTEPFASLRLKAFRRGEQDVEYLALLAAKDGWDREAVSRAVRGALDLTAYDKVKDAALDALRLRIAMAIAR